jgi:uncharacterized metal-binding protein/predicted Fe-Mo cluster-binding NifX family protein
VKIERQEYMIYGIPLFGNRVAPRCTIADSILLIKVTMDRIVYKKNLKIDEKSWNGLLKIFNDNNVDTLVCGGINYDNKKLTTDQGISVVDNVACTDREVIEAIKEKTLKAGYGFSIETNNDLKFSNSTYAKKNAGLKEEIDCLACEDYRCIEGKPYSLSSQLKPETGSRETLQMLNSAMDISLENERVLCRISELIYFAIEMNYKKIGIAFCTDLAEPSQIVSKVMRRFFNVVPVCCKIGGKRLADASLTETDKIACNPFGQAEILNKAGTDFNVIIGLCIGTDCIFTELSNAPVSTLFVKDKSLANNPIGAVYSDYYLKEVTNTQVI